MGADYELPGRQLRGGGLSRRVGGVFIAFIVGALRPALAEDVRAFAGHDGRCRGVVLTVCAYCQGNVDVRVEEGATGTCTKL